MTCGLHVLAAATTVSHPRGETGCDKLAKGSVGQSENLAVLGDCSTAWRVQNAASSPHSVLSRKACSRKCLRRARDPRAVWSGACSSMAGWRWQSAQAAGSTREACLFCDGLWAPSLAAGASCLCFLTCVCELRLAPPHFFLALLVVTPARWPPPKASALGETALVSTLHPGCQLKGHCAFTSCGPCHSSDNQPSSQSPRLHFLPDWTLKHHKKQQEKQTVINTEVSGEDEVTY